MGDTTGMQQSAKKSEGKLLRLPLTLYPILGNRVLPSPAYLAVSLSPGVVQARPAVTLQRAECGTWCGAACVQPNLHVGCKPGWAFMPGAAASGTTWHARRRRRRRRRRPRTGTRGLSLRWSMCSGTVHGDGLMPERRPDAATRRSN